MSDTVRDTLAAEFSNVLSEAETLLDKASRETGDKARDLRAPVEWPIPTTLTPAPGR